MNQRTDFYKASPDALKAMIALEGAVNKLGLETSLLDLIKLRQSSAVTFKKITEHGPLATKAGLIHLGHFLGIRERDRAGVVGGGGIAGQSTAGVRHPAA